MSGHGAGLTDLLSTAGILVDVSDRLRRGHATNRSAWQSATRRSRGLAVSAARHHAERLNDQLLTVAAGARCGAGVLYKAAEKNSLLDGHEHAVRQLAVTAGCPPGLRAGIRRELEEISFLRDELDRQTARAIDRIDLARDWRTRSDPPPSATPELAHSHRLSLDDIHARVLGNRAVGPLVHELARQYPDMRLLQAGDGHLVACFGDLDTAPAAVTLVSGVHSSQPETWGGILHRARGMHRASGAATIAWLGYRAPDTIAGAVSPVNGRKGARSLQRFQQSLHDRAVIRGHRQRLGIVGHSYGSFTAASAAQLPGGLWCDRMFLLGSPGIGTGDLADLHLRPTTRPATDGTALWAAINVGDPIAAADDLTGEILGKDPTEFDSGITVHVGVGGHSDYFTDPVFLRNLSALTTGG